MTADFIPMDGWFRCLLCDDNQWRIGETLQGEDFAPAYKCIQCGAIHSITPDGRWVMISVDKQMVDVIVKENN